MALSINQIKSGLVVEIDNVLFHVVDSQHIKPGKGAAFAKVRLRNVRTQQVFERTIRSADKVEDVFLEERKLQKLYDKGESCVFMDNTSFEEVEVSHKIIGDSLKFLQDNIEVVGLFHHDEMLQIILPNFIVVEIIHTEPGFRGDTTKAGNKPATIEGGATIQVPLFVEVGEFIKIDTRDGAYVERVKK